jgi:hypothetical protein
MKLYYHQKNATLTLSIYLLAGMLLAGCRKEKAIEPSNLDKNYFVIEDNPNDPVDHAIYAFYKSTGVATFYTDTFYKKRISREGEIPERFIYIKLTLNYTPLGNLNVYSKPLSSRTNIQPLLQLMETEVLPKLPSIGIIPSILLIDSFSDHTFKNIQISHGLTAIYGFNTVGIKVENVGMMNNEERKMYAASILAGIAIKKLSDFYAGQLQKDFFSISRGATKNTIPMDIYTEGIPWLLLLPQGEEPPPLSIGLLFYPTYNSPFGDFPAMPREADDLRAFLTAAFYYTAQDFADLHPNETLVLQKFNIIRSIVKDSGFRIPE